MPAKALPLLCAIALALCVAGCETSWHYYWIVDNRSGRPLPVHVERIEAGIIPINSAAYPSSDTIPPYSSRLIAEGLRLNGGPSPGYHNFRLSIFNGNSLIFHEDQYMSGNWRTVVMANAPLYSVNFWLEVADTGVVRPASAGR
jgi:hypothetical protein